MGRYLTYRNDTTFVRVELDDRDRSFNVLFGPLVNGDIPEYPIFLAPSAEAVRWFPLWALLEVRGEEAPPFSFDESHLDAELQAWADALREHAGPAIDGDFSVLEACTTSSERTWSVECASTTDRLHARAAT